MELVTSCVAVLVSQVGSTMMPMLPRRGSNRLWALIQYNLGTGDCDGCGEMLNGGASSLRVERHKFRTLLKRPANERTCWHTTCSATLVIHLSRELSLIFRLRCSLLEPPSVMRIMLRPASKDFFMCRRAADDNQRVVIMKGSRFVIVAQHARQTHQRRGLEIIRKIAINAMRDCLVLAKIAWV